MGRREPVRNGSGLRTPLRIASAGLYTLLVAVGWWVVTGQGLPALVAVGLAAVAWSATYILLRRDTPTADLMGRVHASDLEALRADLELFRRLLRNGRRKRRARRQGRA